ncbi:MAG: hypothetical protein M3Q73_03105 [bacterium]|nr:hypothetical protein [bacterium]
MIRSRKFLLIVIGCLIAAICICVYLARNETVDFQLLSEAPLEVKTAGIHIREIKTSLHPEFLLLYNTTSDKTLYQRYEVEAKLDADILKIYITEKPASTESQISSSLNVLFQPNSNPTSIETYLNGQKQPFFSL